jgi:predicted RNA-binding protein associated with RNAse of E/G family
VTTPITVRKHDQNGNLRFAYAGEVLERGATWVCLRATFNFDKVDLGVVAFLRGDVFTEFYYTDRWYTAYQINSGMDGNFKGWYCDIVRPAVITDENGALTVTYEDLALDVFVTPDREVTVLDEDEFAALNLSPDERAAALNAIEQIRQLVATHQSPFDQPTPNN